MNDMWDVCDSPDIDRLLRECDVTSMEMPNLEAEPHLLISKVRKHYLEYIIRLLTVNYEKNQKLLGKNIYLPSAIWRCAKHIELNAAQACMVAELYRKNVVDVIKLVKSDTKKGKLNRKLLECLQKPPENEKKLQVNLGTRQKDCKCQCTCNRSASKRQKLSRSLRKHITETNNSYDVMQLAGVTTNTSIPIESTHCTDIQYQIPVITNSKDYSNNFSNQQFDQIMQPPQPTMLFPQQAVEKTVPMQPPQQLTCNNDSQSCKVSSQRMSIESQDSEDQVMIQLEQLFRADSNDIEDDLFEGGLYDGIDFAHDEQEKTKTLQESLETSNTTAEPTIVDSQAAKLKSIDERLALLESAGILKSSKTESKGTNEGQVKERKKPSQNKWLCEHYFQKLYLYEKVDEIRESNRKKHARIKSKFLELFGEDSDDEESVMSPLEESPEFVLSCKERMAPWIVKLLTPYYVKGRIRGKTLFKALARHLIRLIYQCSRYPSQYEVNSFVSDFLKSHKLIRCEADFKEFKIENI